jgi:hypothetical protein
VGTWRYQIPFRVDGWIIDVEPFISQASGERQDGFLTRDRSVVTLCLDVADVGIEGSNISVRGPAAARSSNETE